MDLKSERLAMHQADHAQMAVRDCQFPGSGGASGRCRILPHAMKARLALRASARDIGRGRPAVDECLANPVRSGRKQP